MSTKSRGRVLMDQKANCVADVAAVLLLQERAERERGEGKGGKKWGGVGPVDGVRVFWADIRDAEFAEAWPGAVVHAGLGRSRYTAAFPVEGEGEKTEVGVQGPEVDGPVQGAQEMAGGEEAAEERKKVAL